jgi:hypothetical protein
MPEAYLTVILISYMAMVAAATGGAYTQPKSLTRSAPELRSLRTGR